VQQACFDCDGFKGYPHFKPINKLTFVSKTINGISAIGCLDEDGVISVWNIFEIPSFNQDQDNNLSFNAKHKMTMQFSDNLKLYPNVIDYFSFEDLTASIEIEFDPCDPKFFFFSTSEGLFKVNKGDENVPVKMNTIGLNSPTALSLNNEGYLLVAFSCGSIW